MPLSGRKNAGRTVLADIGVYGESGVFEKKRILEVEDTKRFPEEHQKETSPPSERFLQWQEARECAAPPISAQRQHLPAVREWYVFLPMK